MTVTWRMSLDRRVAYSEALTWDFFHVTAAVKLVTLISGSKLLRIDYEGYHQPLWF